MNSLAEARAATVPPALSRLRRQLAGGARAVAVALVAAAASLALTAALERPLDGPFFFPSLAVTLVVALYLGLRPGLLTLAATATGHAYLFLEPRGSLGIGRLSEVLRLAAWAATALLATVAVSRFRSASVAARDANLRLAELAAAERRSRQLYQRLQAAAVSCSAARTSAEVATALLEAAQGQLGSSTVNLSSVDERGDLHIVFSQGVPEAELARFPAIEAGAPLPAAECARERRIVTAVGAEIDRRYPALADWRARVGFESLASVPVEAGGELLGVLGLAFPTARPLDDDERRYVTALADQAGQALARARAHEVEARARAEAERISKVKDRLLAVVGHDLRNPLSAIVTAANVMFRRGELSPGDAATLRRVASSADRMHAIIRDLLDFSVVRQGLSIPVQRGPVDLGETARDVLAEFEGRPDAAPIELRTSGPLALDADRQRLAQLLSNLVGNALQHGDGSAVRVELTGAEAGVTLQVHNGGRPIDAAALPHIFEPFRRGSPAAAASRSGNVGLGLFIVEAIAHAHGGAVRVESSAEAGTTFLVTLPRPPS